MVQWYGGDKWTDELLHFHEAGKWGWIWFLMLICNMAVPWLTLWNKTIRRTPWAMFIIGLLINVGMWAERFIIVPVSLAINRMPFRWGDYDTGRRSAHFHWLVAFFILLYMLASRILPLVPVWEVQEGQMAHSIRKYGKEPVVTVSDLE
jgi:hypothetical protein